MKENSTAIMDGCSIHVATVEEHGVRYNMSLSHEPVSELQLDWLSCAAV